LFVSAALSQAFWIYRGSSCRSRSGHLDGGTADHLARLAGFTGNMLSLSPSERFGEQPAAQPGLACQVGESVGGALVVPDRCALLRLDSRSPPAIGRAVLGCLCVGVELASPLVVGMKVKRIVLQPELYFVRALAVACVDASRATRLNGCSRVVM
jgi:hypothetical protein